MRHTDDGLPPTPLEEYALVGDTRTAALSSSGSIDWMCVPRFDGSPLFGCLVGGPGAGRFRVAPAAPAIVTERAYKPRTATVVTTWTTTTGQVTLTEGMVSDIGGRLLPENLLVRHLGTIGQPAEVVIDFDPRLGDDHLAPATTRCGDATICGWGTTAVALTCSHAVEIIPGQPTTVTVSPAHPLTVVLSVADREPLVIVDVRTAREALDDDERRWQGWCDTFDDDLPHRDEVLRSLLTLRLLTYSPSGAPVAAPTTSLPEEIGGVRNWDYRYAWPRDASIGIGAFLGAGDTHEARQFLAWLLHASRLDRPRLPVLLGLHGQHSPAERILPGWPGYAGSSPVRVGNGAADQHQLDGYGWVLDAAAQLTVAGHRLYSETWRAMRGFADEVERRWEEPDSGIWEVRGPPAHHVHSKLMAWLALDRAVAISATRKRPARHTATWARTRDAVAAQVTSLGYNPRLGTYTRSYGSDEVDSAVLVLPLLGIEPAGSARVTGTINAIRTRLSAGGPYLYRYEPGHDGLPGGEGAFLPCSFWLVQALAANGQVDAAGELFDELLGCSSPLGLFSEEADPVSGSFLGNHPQALTHSALVQASLALRAANRTA